MSAKLSTEWLYVPGTRSWMRWTEESRGLMEARALDAGGLHWRLVIDVMENGSATRLLYQDMRGDADRAKAILDAVWALR